MNDVKGVLVISGHLEDSTLLLGFFYQTYIAHYVSLLSLLPASAGLPGERLGFFYVSRCASRVF